MDLSVIIPSRNRAHRLPGLFNDLAKQFLPQDIKWEIIFVDNGSTDQTNDVLRSEVMRGRLPLKTLLEPRPGKSTALNRAIEIAKGDLIAFTDDDVKPVPLWLRAYLKAAEYRREYDGFCGKVLPLWEGELPDWLKDYGVNNLPEGMVNLRDYGPNERELPPNVVPGGGNALLRKNCVKRIGFFREDLGPGTDVPYAEDTEYMRRLSATGQAYWYVPNAVVKHINPAQRMTRAYAKRWVREVAKAQIIAINKDSSFKEIYGVPKYLIRLLLERICKWSTEMSRPQRIKKYLDVMQTCGEVQGYRELSCRRKKQDSTVFDGC